MHGKRGDMIKAKYSEIDDENPEWTKDDFASAERFADLPSSLQGKLRGRPPAAVTKERITIRLSADVLAHFKATGPGWQTRINATLRKAMGSKPT